MDRRRSQPAALRCVHESGAGFFDDGNHLEADRTQLIFVNEGVIVGRRNHSRVRIE